MRIALPSPYSVAANNNDDDDDDDDDDGIATDDQLARLRPA